MRNKRKIEEYEDAMTTCPVCVNYCNTLLTQMC